MSTDAANTLVMYLAGLLSGGGLAASLFVWCGHSVDCKNRDGVGD